MSLAWLAAPLAGIAGNLLSGHSAKKQQERAFKYQLSLWNYQQSHAHQLEVQDLKKAGLNPILSATGGQMASGGTAPVASDPYNYSDLGNIVSNALRLGLEGKRMENETERVKIQEKQTNALIDKMQEEINLLKTQNITNAWQGKYIETQVDSLKRDLWERIDLYDLKKDIMKANKDQAWSMVDRVGAEIEKIGSETNLNYQRVAMLEKQLRVGSYLAGFLPDGFTRELEEDPEKAFINYKDKIIDVINRSSHSMSKSFLSFFIDCAVSLGFGDRMSWIEMLGKKHGLEK